MLKMQFDVLVRRHEDFYFEWVWEIKSSLSKE